MHAWKHILLVGIAITAITFLASLNSSTPSVFAQTGITPSPTPTLATNPPLLTNPNPSDAALVLFVRQLHGMKYDDAYEAQEKTYTETRRENLDVNADGRVEAIVYGFQHYRNSIYVSILTYAPLNSTTTQSHWQEIAFTEDLGNYCLDARVTVQANWTFVDTIGCSGGTGVRNLTWQRQWLECGALICNAAWRGEMLYWQYVYNWDSSVEFRVSRLEQPTADTLVRTTEYWGFHQIPYFGLGDEIPSKPRRVSGPTRQQTFRRISDQFQMQSETQLAIGTEITREFDYTNTAAVELLNQQVIRDMANQSGVAPENPLRAGLEKFWGLSSLPVDQQSLWKKSFESYSPYLAATDHSTPTRVAAVLGSPWNNRCLLVVKQFGEKHLAPLGQLALPCVPSFTRLTWLDIDQDANDELLVLTLANRDYGFSADQPGTQRLTIYRVRDTVQQLAKLDGSVNGQDGIGIQWQTDAKGFQVTAGVIPDPKCGELVCLFTDRRWKTYRWNPQTNTLVPDQLPP